MSETLLLSFKQFLTLAGSRLGSRQLILLQAVVNYMAIGRWMRSHGYQLSARVRNRQDVWNAVSSRVANDPVLYLEFGVASGESMRYWSAALRHRDSILHGFDSFEGLPEAGGPWTKGKFDAGGRVPLIDDQRVRFYPWPNQSARYTRGTAR